MPERRKAEVKSRGARETGPGRAHRRSPGTERAQKIHNSPFSAPAPEGQSQVALPFGREAVGPYPSPKEGAVFLEPGPREEGSAAPRSPLVRRPVRRPEGGGVALVGPAGVPMGQLPPPPEVAAAVRVAAP